MNDREKQIEELATVLSKAIVYDGGYGWDDEQEVDCVETAKNLFNAGYRKMDEVTLKIDLGDITPE